MSHEFGINGTPHHDPQAIRLTRSTPQGQLACSSGHIFDSSRFSSNYVWFAYHFMLNSVAPYLRALGSLASSCWGGLWVESGLVGNPLLANASFACLGQNPPTAWDGLAHNGSLPFKPQMVIHYWHSTSEPALDMQGQFRASEKD